MSDAITKGVRVQVNSEYLPEESSPDTSQYVFTYHVHITNHSDQPVQLISRHWIITDAEGKKEEVKGLGVIGLQPVLGPGESHEYSSFCPLSTPVGSMHGTYQMLFTNGEAFDAVIAPFSLAVPGVLN